MMIQKTGLAMESSQSMVVYFYKNAFEFSKKGYASALAVFLFLIIMLITALQMKLQKNGLITNRRNSYEVEKVNWGHVIVFIILILCMIVTLLPFVWMILTSLKTQAESICIPLKIFPEKPLFSNYAAVFTKIPFAKMYLNTAVTATVIVVVQLILCSMAAYAFGRIKFPGRNIIFGTLLAVLMVPSSFLSCHSI